VNIGKFISEFNEKTHDQPGVPLPTVVRIYADGSFDFELKSPPASYLIKRAADVAIGSHEPGKNMVGKITRTQAREIAKQKMEDLNAKDLDTALRIIEGTARSCGIEVVD
jgi:large subunit ribosomal protein L11